MELPLWIRDPAWAGMRNAVIQPGRQRGVTLPSRLGDTCRRNGGSRRRGRRPHARARSRAARGLARAVKVAYPGREGAHSAAACSLLFRTRTYRRCRPSPTSSPPSRRPASTRACCRSGSISGPVAETHDLLVDSATSINGQAILPIRHFLVGVVAEVPLPEIRVVRSHPVALDQYPSSARIAAGGAGDRSRHDRRRRGAGGPRRRPGRGRDRERARGRGATRARRPRSRRRRPPGGVHPFRGDLEPDAARRRRRLADRLLVPDRSPARRAPPRDRALRAPRARPRPADLATHPPGLAWRYRFDAVVSGHPLDPVVCETLAEVRRQAWFADLGSYPAQLSGVCIPRGLQRGSSQRIRSGSTPRDAARSSVSGWNRTMSTTGWRVGMDGLTSQPIRFSAVAA